VPSAREMIFELPVDGFGTVVGQWKFLENGVSEVPQIFGKERLSWACHCAAVDEGCPEVLLEFYKMSIDEEMKTNHRNESFLLISLSTSSASTKYAPVSAIML
jgi:hypothetical protein